MAQRILVAYASKHGATTEIAQYIGRTLRKEGFRTDVHPVDTVLSLAPYRAVIVGSAVYAGHWRKEAATFLTTHREELADRDVWLFSSGPTGEGDPVALTDGWRLPTTLQPVVDAIQPHDTAVFHGKLDPETLNLAERMIVKGVHAPTGDFRDWNTISAWTTRITATLKAPISML